MTSNASLFLPAGACLRRLHCLCILLLGLASIFGSASLLQAAKTEMDLLNNTRALRISDRFWYQVLEEREQPVRLFVDNRGFVDVPYIGEVYALGKTPRQLAFDLKTLLEVDFFHYATVIIKVRDGENTRGEITILGEVLSPGKHTIPADQIMYVSDAVLAAGNFTNQADGHAVTVVRQDPENPDSEVRFIVDVQGILETGRYEYDMPVEADDLLIVHKQDSVDGQVYITGEVRSPGLYPIPPDQNFTVSRAILAAGGFTKWARDDKVKLIRAGDQLSPEERTLIVDCERILKENIRDFDPVVKPGDVIRVEERTVVF